MRKWWISAVVVAGWVSLANLASAQYLPEGRPSAPLADPVPVSSSSNAGLANAANPAVPGPMNGYLAPYGPGEDMMLPANHSNAYPTEPRYEPEFCFFHFGTLALKRQKLGNGITAFRDSSVASRTDTGIPAFFRSVVPLMNLDQLDPRLTWGGVATVGYMFGTYSIELTGLWIPEMSVNSEVQRPGQLHTSFFNSPPGFEGNNNLFRQADVIRQEFTSQMAGGELNLRYFSQAYTAMEVLCGIRYLDYTERLGITVDDDGLTVQDILGQGNPNLMATYVSRTRNHIVGPQLGIELQRSLFQGFAVGAYAKAAPGLNVSNVDISLRRGDGAVGLDGTRNDMTFACIFDAGVYLDVYCLERLRVRTGYQVLGLTGVLEAPDQVSYDLSNVAGRRDVSGAILFQGLTVQMQFLF